MVQPRLSFKPEHLLLLRSKLQQPMDETMMNAFGCSIWPRNLTFQGSLNKLFTSYVSPQMPSSCSKTSKFWQKHQHHPLNQIMDRRHDGKQDDLSFATQWWSNILTQVLYYTDQAIRIHLTSCSKWDTFKKGLTKFSSWMTRWTWLNKETARTRSQLTFISNTQKATRMI